MHMKRQNTHLTIAAFAVLISGLTAHAAIDANGVNVSSLADSQPTAATYLPDIVLTDLIDQSQPSLASSTTNKEPYWADNELNDGPGVYNEGTFLPETFGNKGKLPFNFT